MTGLSPNPRFRRVPPPPPIFKPARRGYSTADPPARPSLLHLRRQERRAGSRFTLETPPAPTSLTQDVLDNHTIVPHKKTGGRCVIQGPKSKTHALIAFKIVEGFKTYLAYIYSIKHLKTACMGEYANNYEINVLKPQTSRLPVLFLVSQRGASEVIFRG